MRKLLFEFEDLVWLPGDIRDGMTDFLQFLLSAINFYEPVVPLLKEAMDKTGQRKVLDLCSGGGGPLLQIQEELQRVFNKEIKFILTDKYPNTDKYRYIIKRTSGSFVFEKKSIDASQVPCSINAFRTMFSASHHFHPQILKKVLESAVQNNKGVAIFDGGSKSVLLIFVILLTFPFLFLVFTPFLKPFKFSRLLFTYLMPIIPLFTIWDGIVSIIRLYSPEQLLEIAVSTPSKGYEWKSGKVKNKLGIKISYLIGYPEQSNKVNIQKNYYLSEGYVFEGV